MHSLSFAAFAILMRVGQSQQLGNLVPSCAGPCLAKAIPDVGCSATDTTCLCTTHKTALFASVATCLLTECSPSDIQSTHDDFTSFCASAAVGLFTSSTTRGLSTTSSVISSSAVASRATSYTSIIAKPVQSTSSALVVSLASSTQNSSAIVPSPTMTPPILFTSTLIGTTITTPEVAADGDTSTSQTTTGGALTPGARAAIGVTVALVVFIAVLVAWFYIRRHKRQQKSNTESALENSYAASPNRGFETMSSSNVHEMDNKSAANAQFSHLKRFGKAKTEDPYGPNYSTIIPEMDSANEKAKKQYSYPLQFQRPLSAHEMDTAECMKSAFVAIEVVELDSRLIPLPNQTTFSTEQGRDSHELFLDRPSLTPSSGLSSGDRANAEGRLDILRKRIDRVREDKARLEKIQRLEDIEAELKREIMTEQERTTGIR